MLLLMLLYFYFLLSVQDLGLRVRYLEFLGLEDLPLVNLFYRCNLRRICVRGLSLLSPSLGFVCCCLCHRIL